MTQSEQHEHRLPESKMTSFEKTFALSLLRPQIYTKSRPAFLLMSLSPKMALVVAIFTNGTIDSVMFFNNSQQLNCDEFDRFQGEEPINKQSAFVSGYKSEENIILKRRADFLDLFNFMQKFGVVLNKGQLQNIFHPKPPSFLLMKCVNGYNLRTFFICLPIRRMVNCHHMKHFTFLNEVEFFQTNFLSFLNFVIFIFLRIWMISVFNHQEESSMDLKKRKIF